MASRVFLSRITGIGDTGAPNDDLPLTRPQLGQAEIPSGSSKVRAGSEFATRLDEVAPGVQLEYLRNRLAGIYVFMDLRLRRVFSFDDSGQHPKRKVRLVGRGESRRSLRSNETRRIAAQSLVSTFRAPTQGAAHPLTPETIRRCGLLDQVGLADSYPTSCHPQDRFQHRRNPRLRFLAR